MRLIHAAFHTLIAVVLGGNLPNRTIPLITLKRSIFQNSNSKSEYQRINYFKQYSARASSSYRSTQQYLSRKEVGEPPFYATVFNFPLAIDSAVSPNYFEKAIYTGLKKKLWWDYRDDCLFKHCRRCTRTRPCHKNLHVYSAF